LSSRDIIQLTHTSFCSGLILVDRSTSKTQVGLISRDLNMLFNVVMYRRRYWQGSKLFEQYWRSRPARDNAIILTIRWLQWNLWSTQAFLLTGLVWLSVVMTRGYYWRLALTLREQS